MGGPIAVLHIRHAFAYLPARKARMESVSLSNEATVWPLFEMLLSCSYSDRFWAYSAGFGSCV